MSRSVRGRVPKESRPEAGQPAGAMTGAGVPIWRVAGRAAQRASDIDVALAVVAFVALLADSAVGHGTGQLTPVAYLLALLTAAPLVARRRFPVGVLATVVPLVLVCLAVFHPNRAAVGVVMLLVFTVGLDGHRTRSLVVGALMAPVVAAAVLITGRHGTVVDVVAYASLVLGALAAGEALRARQALQHAIAEEAARQRDAAAQHRFDQERLAWAHELHDVVGHALVAINVRAAAAAHLERQRSGSAAPSALDEIAAASAEALGELRATLGTLRAKGDGPAPLHPIQELADLATLVAGVEDAGLTVELHMPDMATALPATIGHAGYRIVQEGLTNVLRHSTAKHVSVRVGVQAGALVIQVDDDGRLPPGSSTPGSSMPGSSTSGSSTSGGHGLVGMRERAAALGGGCEAGAAPGGGWRIRARIPLERPTP